MPQNLTCFKQKVLLLSKQHFSSCRREANIVVTHSAVKTTKAVSASQSRLPAKSSNDQALQSSNNVEKLCCAAAAMLARQNHHKKELKESGYQTEKKQTNKKANR